MNMTEEFRTKLFETLRNLTRKYVEAYQTDLAIDIERLLTADFTEPVTWYGRTFGTNLARNDDERRMYEDAFSNIRVRVDIDFENSTYTVTHVDSKHASVV